MKRSYGSEVDLRAAEEGGLGWRLEADELERFPGSHDGGHSEDLLLGPVVPGPSGQRQLSGQDEVAGCFLEQMDGEGQFPFESASASGDTMAGRRQVENAAAGGVGAGSWGPSDGPYAYGDGGFAFEGSASGKGTGRGAPGGRETDMHSAGRRSEGGGMREPRRLPERDMYGQTSLERLEEENSSLRAITKYLIHERKELRKKADMASKRNQNLNNLLQVMKWSLQQGGAGACGASACGAVASSSRAMPRMAASNSSSWHSMTLVPEGDLAPQQEPGKAGHCVPHW